MIQKSKRKEGVSDKQIKEYFDSIVRALKMPEPEKDEFEYDMTEKYVPNWACMWNKVTNIGKECIIDVKDDRFAIVAFNNIMRTKDNVISHIYRLEDLTLK